MTFEERQTLRLKISDIQRRKEHHARFMRVTTLYGIRIHLGGGCRPKEEQIRGGYPIRHLPDYEGRLG